MNGNDDGTIREGFPPRSGQGRFAESGTHGGEPTRLRPSPAWNLVSLAAPLVGFVLAIPFGLWMVWLTGRHPAWMAKPSASFLAASSVFGLIAGCIAAARKERLWGFTLAAIALNAAVLAAYAYLDPWSGSF